MKKFFPLLKKSVLFYGIAENEIESMLTCLSATVRTYQKGENIFRAGDHVSAVALLLEGSVHIQKEDYWGNLSILNDISAGEIFGEVYACLGAEAMSNNVVAAKTSRVLFIDVKRILTVCSSACAFHTKLVQNLLSVLAMKNRLLTRKIEHISQRSTRSKLLSYLSEQSQEAGSSSFDIPFNRQQLADFLSVDRSAMSNELGKMRDEGLLTFKKNHFTLL